MGGPIERRSFVDPTLDQRELLRRKWVCLLRHAIVWIGLNNQPVELRFLCLAGNDRLDLAVAPTKEVSESVEPIAAFCRFLAVDMSRIAAAAAVQFPRESLPAGQAIVLKARSRFRPAAAE
jgi:hypothetical protein